LGVDALLPGIAVLAESAGPPLPLAALVSFCPGGVFIGAVTGTQDYACCKKQNKYFFHRMLFNVVNNVV
jgi:hypothetical protein